PGDVVDVQLDANGEAVAPSLADLEISISDDLSTEEELVVSFEPEIITTSTQLLTIRVTDKCGKTSICAFPINPIPFDPCSEDFASPTIDGCPDDVVDVQLDANGEAVAPSLADLEISISDDLSTEEELVVTFEPEVITASTQLLTIRVTDECGKTSICAFPVNPITLDPCENDVEGPQIFALFEDGSQVFASELNSIFGSTIFECDEQPSFALIIVDNCDPNASIVGEAGGTRINEDGTFTVSRGVTAADASGNETSAGYSYTYADTKAPVLDCSGDAQTFTLDVCGSITLTPEDLGITATDNCSENIAISLSQSSFEGAGNTEVVVTAVDDSGNEESCTIALTLENNPDAITVTANDDDLSVSEGETITFNVLANDFASDGSALEVQDLVLANPADGTLVDNGDGTYDFTPAEGFVGEVILTYIAKSEDASLFFEG
ncbi:MAG: Ig-like domain-containing protein, partial [Bacteroidota bacterium]